MLMESAGGRMLSYYVTTGDSDFMAIAEFPDMESAAAALLVAPASGSISDTVTRQAWSYGEFTRIAERAGTLGGAYTPPG